MAIEFLCPNGHRLSSPEASSGRPGRCPKCQAVFRVPQQGGARATPSDSGHSLSNLEEAESLSARTSSSKLGIDVPPGQRNGGANDEVIVFLCPNGHKLNGPVNMQGKPGQCPHCGAKFIIPSYDDPAEEGSLEIVDDDVTLGELERLQGSSPVRDRSNSDSALPLRGSGAGNDGRTVSPHPMATAFTEVWEKRQIGRMVELFTTDGAKVTCERFRAASAQEHAGIFATRDEAGSLAVVVVAWDSVARVIMRGVRDLPPGMFD